MSKISELFARRNRERKAKQGFDRPRTSKQEREYLAGFGLKKCSKCREVYKFENFTKCSETVDQLFPQCRHCREKYNQTAEAKASKRKYRNSTKHKEASEGYKQTTSYKNAITESRHTRRARLANAPSDNWKASEVHSEANGRCLYCGIKVTLDEMEPDHFIPLAKGGSNLRENIVCSCRSCNRKKHDKMPEDFIGETL